MTGVKHGCAQAHSTLARHAHSPVEPAACRHTGPGAHSGLGSTAAKMAALRSTGATGASTGARSGDGASADGGESSGGTSTLSACARCAHPVPHIRMRCPVMLACILRAGRCHVHDQAPNFQLQRSRARVWGSGHCPVWHVPAVLWGAAACSPYTKVHHPKHAPDTHGTPGSTVVRSAAARCAPRRGSLTPAARAAPGRTPGASWGEWFYARHVTVHPEENLLLKVHERQRCSLITIISCICFQQTWLW